ncbi:MAG: hypothetical protein ABJA84_02485 [Polaromonas sp.]
MSTLPAGFAKLIRPFTCLFSRRVFQPVQLLLAGAILASLERNHPDQQELQGNKYEVHGGVRAVASQGDSALANAR